MQIRDTYLTTVTSECKMQEIVLNKVTPTRNAGHLHGWATATMAPEKTQPRRQQNYLEETFGLFTVTDKGDPSILVDLSINGTPVTMTLVTGASISIISEKTYIPDTVFAATVIQIRVVTKNIRILDSP